MTDFKLGDKVKRVSGRTNSGMEAGETGVVYEIYHPGFFDVKMDKNNAIAHGCAMQYYELVKESTMEVTRENLNNHTIYVLTKDSSFLKGTEIRLVEDDTSDCPKFESLDAHKQMYESITNLEVFGTEPKLTEVTLEEVAEAMGIDVKQLRIKE